MSGKENDGSRFNFTSVLAYNFVTSLTLSMKCLISTYVASRTVGREDHKSSDYIANYFYPQLTTLAVDRKKIKHYIKLPLKIWC